MKLGAVVLPVADVDRAKEFYRAAGFREVVDYTAGTDFRVVRFTPPGSDASIVFGVGVSDARPGSVGGLHLVVADIDAARAALAGRGIAVSDVFHDVGGNFYHCSPAYEVPGRDPARRENASFARFSDADGNGWVLEEAGTNVPSP
jgi:catechol 2,3-dioxygenase-like lactoylglutathione lyase family enzyme